jgi:hypothetical protein
MGTGASWRHGEIAWRYWPTLYCYRILQTENVEYFDWTKTWKYTFFTVDPVKLIWHTRVGGEVKTHRTDLAISFSMWMRTRTDAHFSVRPPSRCNGERRWKGTYVGSIIRSCNLYPVLWCHMALMASVHFHMHADMGLVSKPSPPSGSDTLHLSPLSFYRITRLASGICAAKLTTLIYIVTIKNQSYLLFWMVGQTGAAAWW